MHLHQADEYQESTPDHADCQHNGKDAALFKGQSVADNHHGKLDQDIGHQCVAHGHINIPEPALALKQGGHRPVGNTQYQEWQRQRGRLLQDIQILNRRVDKLEAGQDQLQDTH